MVAIFMNALRNEICFKLTGSNKETEQTERLCRPEGVLGIRSKCYWPEPKTNWSEYAVIERNI